MALDEILSFLEAEPGSFSDQLDRLDLLTLRERSPDFRDGEERGFFG